MRVGWWLIVVTGCGLSLDLSPDDPARLDAGPRVDGGREVECRTDVDCDDDDACNGVELCSEGRCVDGSAVVCPDDDVCDGSTACDARTGECSVIVPPPACEGGDACSGLVVCDPVAGCITAPGLRCDDGVACTEDVCDEGSCQHLPRDALCDRAEGGQCSDAGCVYATCTDELCVAENPCQTARCDGLACIREVLECAEGEACCGGVCKPLGCEDGNPCTRDYCDPMASCQHEPAALPLACDDGDPCTSGDRCDGARCAPGGASCTEGDTCNAPICDAVTGRCSTVPVDGVACSDGNPCSVDDRCSGGVCRAGSMADCDDRNPCTADGCRASGCAHTNVANETACTLLGNEGTCRDGRCLVSSLCAVGSADCDGDGDCECSGTCTTSMSGNRVCSMSACASCDRGETCCNLIGSRDYGFCIGPETVCLGGTCCVVDGI